MSPDGTRVLAPTLSFGLPITDGTDAVWEICSDGWIYRNRIRTNGGASELLWFGGFVWAKSQKVRQVGVWFNVVSVSPAGGVAWRKFTTADPAGTSTADADWLARKNAPGVVWTCDFDADIPVSATGQDSFGLIAGSATTPTRDTAVKASGLSSLRFDIPSLSGANAAGEFYANFPPFGENATRYFQVRWRCNQALLDTVFRDAQGDIQAGIKLFDIFAGFQAATAARPFPLFFYSSGDPKTVFQTSYGSPTPIGYAYDSRASGYKNNTGFLQTVNGDIGLQNAMPAPFCTYQSSRPGGVYKPGPVPGCFNLVSEEWMTLEAQITHGALGTDSHGVAVYTNCTIKLWAARENQAPQLLIDWNPSVDGYYDLFASDTYRTDAQGNPARYPIEIGQIAFLSFMTGKDPTQAHPLCQVRYDEAIISQNPIAFPGGFPLTGGAVPASPTVTLTANPSSVVAGSPSTLAWTSANSTGVSIDQGIGAVALNGSQQVTPAATTIYTATATGAAGTTPATAPRTVTVRAAGSSSLSTLAAGKVRDLCSYDVPFPGVTQGGHISDYSGIVIDAGRRRAYLNGGGHGSYIGDGTLELPFDDAAPVWSALYVPTPYDQITAENLDKPFGRMISNNHPVARHTCNGLCVGNGKLFCMNPSGMSHLWGQQEGDPSSWGGRFWNYNLAGSGAPGDFTYSNISHTDVPWLFSAGTCFDDPSGKVIIAGSLGASTWFYMWLYDPVADTISPLWDSGFTYFSRSTVEIVLNTTNGLYYIFFQNGDVFTLNFNRTTPTSSVVTKLTVTGAPLMPLTIENGMAPVSMGFFRTRNIFGGMVESGIFNEFDPATNEWSQVQMVNETGGNATMTQAFQCGKADPVSECYIFLDTLPNSTPPGLARTFVYRP